MFGGPHVARELRVERTDLSNSNYIKLGAADVSTTNIKCKVIGRTGSDSYDRSRKQFHGA